MNVANGTKSNQVPQNHLQFHETLAPIMVPGRKEVVLF